MTLKVCAIVAMDEGRVIGISGKLPWDIPEDMKHFSALTKGHTVLMGRKTYESLPERFRPLPNRKNIVISRTANNQTWPGVDVWDSPEKCIQACRTGALKLQGEKLWIIGGAELYRQTIGLCDELYLTLVQGRHEGDTFFPSFEQNFELLEEEKHAGFSFMRFSRRGE